MDRVIYTREAPVQATLRWTEAAPAVRRISASFRAELTRSGPHIPVWDKGHREDSIFSRAVTSKRALLEAF